MAIFAKSYYFTWFINIYSIFYFVRIFVSKMIGRLDHASYDPRFHSAIFIGSEKIFFWVFLAKLSYILRTKTIGYKLNEHFLFSFSFPNLFMMNWGYYFLNYHTIDFFKSCIMWKEILIRPPNTFLTKYFQFLLRTFFRSTKYIETNRFISCWWTSKYPL